MKKLLAALVIGLCVQSAQATLYNDNTGDTFTGAGGGILDIVSLEVTDDGTDISFKFTLVGDTEATDWGKYMVIIDSVAGGDTGGNGWARPISMPSGADYWIGSWVDSGDGAELYNYGGSWTLTQATYNPPPLDITISNSTTMVTITTQLAAMGLGPNQTILLDAFTSGGGGGDGAVDSLGNPGQQIGDWGNASEAHPVEYTTTPEPTTLGLLALGGLMLVRRRR
ncbi:MAG TPA: PEP-CTERM sorting domain-containing protein [Phycisphaerae bacterium]|nr:PEP-CTERM sorting domain-containing protein [Phycisphaerae bacterium]